MERPFGANGTYAEVHFDLTTAERKIQWFQINNLVYLCTNSPHDVWDRVHQALLQNNIGYILDALDLEKRSRWLVFCSV